MSEFFSCAPAGGDIGQAPMRIKRNGKTKIIDIHCHMGVPAAFAAAGPPPPPEANPMSQFTTAATEDVNRAQFAEIAGQLNGVEQRLKDMDRLGIDIQAISPSPGQYYYHAAPEHGLAASRIVNDKIAEAVAQHPDRLVGMGTCPLQAPELAIAEMKRCKNELGFRGIEISSNVAGRELADKSFWPFFAAAEELGMLIFLHPLGFTHGQRLCEHYFNNLIGNPLESAVAVGHLIFSGLLDKHAGLKLCVAHGGGYLPAYWGRMDHAWRARSDCRQHISRAPSSYLQQLYFDTLVFDRAQLDFLVKTYGADHLCLGTDYPFDMSEPDPIGFHAHLAAEDHEKICGGTAARLLNIEPSHAHAGD